MENECRNFSQNLIRWSELDLSRAFQLFYRQIKFKMDNYALIINNQEFIFSKMMDHLSLEHLNKNGWLAVPAIMEFLVAFATDLASDFTKYIYRCFSTLSALLSTRDLEMTESIFTCASQLIKINNKFLLSDLSNVINVFTDLVTAHKREHIQNFAGDAFGYLIRKLALKNPETVSGFWAGVIEKLDSQSENEKLTNQKLNGTGLLLFQALRGIKSQMDYRAEKILVPLIKLSVFKPTGKKIIQNASVPLFDHLHRDHSGTFSKTLPTDLEGSKLGADIFFSKADKAKSFNGLFLGII